MSLIPSKRYIGIFFDDEEDLWKVVIDTDGGVVQCGEFQDEIEAAHEYDQCVIDLVPGIPELNFPNE